MRSLDKISKVIRSNSKSYYLNCSKLNLEHILHFQILTFTWDGWDMWPHQGAHLVPTCGAWLTVMYMIWTYYLLVVYILWHLYASIKYIQTVQCYNDYQLGPIGRITSMSLRVIIWFMYMVTDDYDYIYAMLATCL